MVGHIRASVRCASQDAGTVLGNPTTISTTHDDAKQFDRNTDHGEDDDDNTDGEERRPQ